MRPIKPMKSSEKKKRMIEFRMGIGTDWKNSQPQFNNYQHNRSSSGGRNKKLRLINEYEDTEQKGSSEKQNKKGNTGRKKK